VSKLLRPRVLAALVVVALVVALGISVGLLARRAQIAQGRVLVLLTVDLPLPPSPAVLQARATGLKLLPSGSGRSWVTVPVPSTAVTLPGTWVAPNPDNLFLATVPVGQYREAELVLRSSSGSRLLDHQSLILRVVATGLTPLLFTFRDGSATAPAPVTATAAYGGNDQVNFGLQAASNKVISLPTVPLVNQSGQPVTLQNYPGKILVVASFLTECQETCPLVAAALLQLQELLDQKNLQSHVQIVEVSQDAAHDTPAILSKYQHYFSLPWPLLTGSAANLDQFWTHLKVPPIQDQPWAGAAPVDMFTGQPEQYNIVHASVIDIVDPQGYVVSELEAQPTLSSSAIPTLIYKYLDAQGHQQQKAGGSWNPQTLYNDITPLLQAKGVYTNLQPSGGGPVTVGDAAPDFSLPSSDGARLELNQELGHPVLIDFWATWCTNCRADMRLVAQTAARYQSQGLRVVLIDYGESKATVDKFLKGLGVSLPSLLDSNEAVAQRYGVPGLPVAVFVNATGKITALQLGQLTQAEVNQDIPTAMGS
jgi:cytochrome oxidase Cu insertion factor (SCO1/SenC/PrrC family)